MVWSCDWFNEVHLPELCRGLMVEKVGVKIKLPRLTLEVSPRKEDVKERVARGGDS